MGELCLLLVGWTLFVLLVHYVRTDNQLINRRLIFLDKQCFKHFKRNLTAHGIRVRQCSYKRGALGTSSIFSGYKIHTYAQNGSDHWVLDIALDVAGSFCDHTLLIKAGFESRGYYIIRKDKLCLEFIKTTPMEPRVSKVHFSCLRLEHGQSGTVTLLNHHPKSDNCTTKKVRNRKHDFNTECQCLEQKANAHLDDMDMLKVTFHKTFAVTGYCVRVQDVVTRRQIVKPENVSLRNEQEFVEHKSYVGHVDGKITVKITFWCSDSKTTSSLDRECTDVVHYIDKVERTTIRSKEKHSSVSKERHWDYKDLAFLIVAPTVVIFLAVTLLVLRKKNLEKCMPTR